MSGMTDRVALLWREQWDRKGNRRGLRREGVCTESIAV